MPGGRRGLAALWSTRPGSDTDRRRPPRPRTCSPNLRRQQALPGSHGTGSVAAVTPGLWSSAPGSAAEPSRESPTFPGKGPAHGVLWVAPDGRRTRPPADPERRATLTPRLSRAFAWEPAPGPAGRGDADTRREGGSWEDSPGSCGRRRAPQRFPRLGLRRPRGQALLLGGLRNLVKLRLCGL